MKVSLLWLQTMWYNFLIKDELSYSDLRSMILSLEVSCRNLIRPHIWKFSPNLRAIIKEITEFKTSFREMTTEYPRTLPGPLSSLSPLGFCFSGSSNKPYSNMSQSQEQYSRDNNLTQHAPNLYSLYVSIFCCSLLGKVSSEKKT